LTNHITTSIGLGAADGYTRRKVQVWTMAVVSACLGMVVHSCDAPHDNPFDPSSPGYIPPLPPEAVETLRADSITPTECRLCWMSTEGAHHYLIYSGAADWDGRHTEQADMYPEPVPGVMEAGIPVVKRVSLVPGLTRAWAVFGVSAEGLVSAGSNVVQVTAPLRDRPASTSLIARSNHIAWWGLPDQVTLDLNAAVLDSDRVDSVWVLEDTLFIAALSPVGDGIHWAGEVQEVELPQGSLEALVGHPLALYHHDAAGFTTRDTVFSVIRVIENTPQTLAPARDTLVSQEPHIVLEWKPYDEMFAFTFAVEIIHWSQASVPTKVYEDSLIAADSTIYTVKTELTPEPGVFLWTVTVVDEFGNRARSREASFRISDNE